MQAEKESITNKPPLLRGCASFTWEYGKVILPNPGSLNIP